MAKVVQKVQRNGCLGLTVSAVARDAGLVEGRLGVRQVSDVVLELYPDEEGPIKVNKNLCFMTPSTYVKSIGANYQTEVTLESGQGVVVVTRTGEPTVTEEVSEVTPQ